MLMMLMNERSIALVRTCSHAPVGRTNIFFRSLTSILKNFNKLIELPRADRWIFYWNKVIKASSNKRGR